MTTPPADTADSSGLDVIVVGAGVAGLYALYRLRQSGFRARVFEAGTGVGGTWYWNRYPGCRCDVESLEYSFSFSPDLEQEWRWRERYGTQPELLEYLNHVADRFDLRRDIQFETRVRGARFDSASNRWTIHTSRGDEVCAPFIMMCTGNLSTPRLPDLPGLDHFEGDFHHTGLWPHEGVDFTGKRVGVIGTGSSGVQSIPLIAAQAERLFVFQRTANFILPAQNRPANPEVEREHKATYRERRKAAYDTPFGIAGYPPPTKSALEATEAERNALYEEKWNIGGSISFLYAYTDLLTDEAANETAAEFVRNKIRAIVKDPVTAETLCPDNHPIGTKRLILDTHYFETFNQDHVTLVDVRTNPIEAITPRGLRTTAAEYELDAIVFATGFDAMTGAMKDIDIQVDDDRNINEKWADGPRTYLGVMIAGFPNLFMVTGPQSPGVKSNMMLSCEQHVNFIADCLDHLRATNSDRIEPEPSAEDRWVEHNNQVANATLYPKANSWYMGANIPGKPRIFMPYVGGVQAYSQRCDEVVRNGYEGFRITAHASGRQPGDGNERWGMQAAGE